MNMAIPYIWKFKGGRICLDFINTVGGRVQKSEKNLFDFQILEERLNNFENLLDWANARGIITNVEFNKLSKIENSSDIFMRAINLRESLFQIFISIINEKSPKPEDIIVLNKETLIARENQELFFSSDKFEWRFLKDKIKADYIIWKIAKSAEEVLSSENLNRVKLCIGEDCGWLFLDSSKNRSRQWCDMKDCGNVAKVRRFRNKLRD
jgi:predicted RNA-binding Zn ribbon-like protein